MTENLSKQDKDKSLLVIVVGFLVLFSIFTYLKVDTILWGSFKVIYFFYIALGVGVLSLVSNTIGDLIIKGWFKIATVLGFINTRIVLGLVFFIFLTPFAFLQKLLVRKNYLSLKDTDDTVYSTRNHEYKPEDFDNVW